MSDGSPPRMTAPPELVAMLNHYPSAARELVGAPSRLAAELETDWSMLFDLLPEPATRRR